MRQILILISIVFSLNAFGQGGRLVVNGWRQGGVTTYLYDTFTDSDGTNIGAHTMNIGGGWTAQQNGLCGSASSMTIQSNQAAMGGQFLGIYTADPAVSDYVVSLDVVVPNAASYLGGVVFRFTACGDYWAAFIERDASGTPYLAIVDSQSGTRTYRATVNVPGATNTTLNIKVTLSGNSIVALAGTGETCNYSSSFNNTATKAGLFGYSGGGYTATDGDNFLVTNM